VKIFNQGLYMQENLTSFLCEFWHYFKKPYPDTETLCTWETLHLNVLVLMAH